MTRPDDDDAWVDQLASALGGGQHQVTAQRFARCIPAGYRQHTSPSDAAQDLAVCDDLIGLGHRHEFAVRSGTDGAPGSLRLRRYSLQPGELSSFFPVVESFGLVVAEVVPYLIEPRAEGEAEIHVEDFLLRQLAPASDGGAFNPSGDGPRLVAALRAVEEGLCDVDALNRLVTQVSLGWRQVVVLRAYRRYLEQLDSSLTSAELEGALVAFPEVAQALVRYFEARFEPELADRQEATHEARQQVMSGLAGVPGFEQDSILHRYLDLIGATVRTNYYQPSGDGTPTATVVLKLSPGVDPAPAAKRFWVETFVFGPLVEGIHLRAGPLARGGIRWSTRRGDLRNEVVDLASAQVRKNAIIVPTGAKGGFLCRRPRGLVPTELDVEEAYQAFIEGLLDVTDNVVNQKALLPEHVVAYDGNDPYLVVAPDKGTASLSDFANRLSNQHGFWLGDAFASGGSRGFDHKAMGITSRGAWRAVTSHFRQLGVDVQSESIRVVGIGDMSGDVFGNGMLQSQSLQLVAAFDHRHIFLDPDPDPARSFAERLRLKNLPHSSWDDYDRSLLSPGGGVWSRQAKSIPISPEVRRALGLVEEELSSPGLVSALLGAAVDLLWMAGVGTYVRAPTETDASVGDHLNDAVRITADQVRARVVVEGANLGFTQRARIFYSRRGGRINTDFIDNAAGVTTSDREVNLKILLALAIDEDCLAPAERDAALAAVQDDVADEVLVLVDRSVTSLNHALRSSAEEFDAYRALLADLARKGRLDREAEALPDEGEMTVRRESGAGLLRPELAVLLACAKSALAQEIAESEMVSGPLAIEICRSYFPSALRSRFGDVIPRHRLFPQLVTSMVTNDIVDLMGMVWAHETSEELGRDMVDVASAFWAAREVLGVGALWAELEELTPAISSDAETQLHRTVADAVSGLARTYLVNPGPVVPERLIASDEPLARSVLDDDASSASGLCAETQKALLSYGLEVGVADRFAWLELLCRIGQAGMVVRAVGCSATDALRSFGAIDRVAGLDRLEMSIRSVPRSDRWTSWQSRALLDEVAQWRRLTAQRTLGADPNMGTDDALQAWEDRGSHVFHRSNRFLDDLASPGADRLTLAALMLRSLRSEA